MYTSFVHTYVYHSTLQVIWYATSPHIVVFECIAKKKRKKKQKEIFVYQNQNFPKQRVTVESCWENYSNDKRDSALCGNRSNFATFNGMIERFSLWMRKRHNSCTTFFFSFFLSSVAGFCKGEGVKRGNGNLFDNCYRRGLRRASCEGVGFCTTKQTAIYLSKWNRWRFSLNGDGYESFCLEVWGNITLYIIWMEFKFCVCVCVWGEKGIIYGVVD